jgi:4-diphosphocytidyl-2-C-methyl-D-erythritol kinase
VIVFPNCKINLGLQVCARRADGYHDLDTVFLPLALHDALEFRPSTETRMHTEGLSVPGHPADNIVLKALNMLRQRFPTLPPLDIVLLKAIPTGAGLGGGSADGAFFLEAVNRHFNLAMSPDELAAMALSLGSDCPFFLLNHPAHATGRGEQLQPLTLNLQQWTVLLVKPEFSVSTGWAFAQLEPRSGRPSTAGIISEYPVSEWRTLLENDFEAPIFEQYPQGREIRETLYRLGASYAALTGTGSVVYGLFAPEHGEYLPLNTEWQKLFPGCTVFQTRPL